MQYILAILAIGLTSVLAQYDGTRRRPEIPEAPKVGPEVFEEIQLYNNQLDIVMGDGNRIATILGSIEEKVDEVSTFREQFNNQVRPRIEQSMREQDETINNFKQLLKDLETLPNELADLERQVETIGQEFQVIQEQRRQILTDIQELEDQTAANRARLGPLQDQVEYQARRVENVENRVARNEAFSQSIHRNLETARTITNNEMVQSFRATVTKENPRATVTFEQPFPETPVAFWTLLSFEAIDQSGNDVSVPPPYPGAQSYAPTTAAPVKDVILDVSVVAVSVTRTNVTVELVDRSNYFSVQRATITAAILFNDQETREPEVFATH